jgi:diphosphomevalonate decarboxylase
MKQLFTAQAPSNIAIIKYMGKRDTSSNLPENGSISVTLDDLCTLAELEESPAPGVRWVSEKPGAAQGWRPVHGCGELRPESPALSSEGAAKITRHVERALEACGDLLPSFGLKARVLDRASRGFTLRTANTFPQASGIASSASAFAAVTLAAAQARAENPAEFASVFASDLNLKRALASLSRRGSGSSCRSFEGPWVEWEDERAFAPENRLPKLAHFVVVVSDQPKQVSSSQAHALIKTSPLWAGRVDRVNLRLRELREALRGNPGSAVGAAELRAVARISWTEAWEMHSLFHTCSEPFTYWQPGTIAVLHALSPALREDSPPIATLDAGPNVHILVDESRRAEWRTRLKQSFPGIRILEDGEGAGARLLASVHASEGSSK